jgi:hypothetical protein
MGWMDGWKRRDEEGVRVEGIAFMGKQRQCLFCRVALKITVPIFQDERKRTMPLTEGILHKDCVPRPMLDCWKGCFVARYLW